MQFNQVVTVTAGTPINLATLTNVAPVKGQEIYAFTVSIQMQHGGTGIGYVMDGITLGRLTAPIATNAADLTLELAAATGGAPGGQYFKQIYSGQDRVGVAVHEIWIDVSVTSNVILSYNRM